MRNVFWSGCQRIALIFVHIEISIPKCIPYCFCTQPVADLISASSAFLRILQGHFSLTSLNRETVETEIFFLEIVHRRLIKPNCF